jgi:hypothetical protein
MRKVNGQAAKFYAPAPQKYATRKLASAKFADFSAASGLPYSSLE